MQQRVTVQTDAHGDGTATVDAKTVEDAQIDQGHGQVEVDGSDLKVSQAPANSEVEVVYEDGKKAKAEKVDESAEVGPGGEPVGS